MSSVQVSVYRVWKHVFERKGFAGVVVAIGLLCLAPQGADAQGCVAIRTIGGSSSSGGSAVLPQGVLLSQANYRYFRSFRHFRGDHEEADRVANGTEVVNWNHSIDLGASYGITDRLYTTATLPIIINRRSSLYEHGRTERHETGSSGIGDLRIGAGYWLLDPTHSAANLSVGLGLKLPTGDAGATDEFQNVGPNGESEVRPVDQSIQPGDGGLGVTVDLQAFAPVTGLLSSYFSASYLLNPGDTNGVRTYRETLSPILQNESIQSIPDQYALRAGITQGVSRDLGLTFSLGARFEGVPVEDLIGPSNGFRRPGHVLSVEPGASYAHGPFAATLAVPVAVYRNRPQSLTDLETELATGKPRAGDAAFADYLVNLGISWRFGDKNEPAPFDHMVDTPL